jgi:hypothetical protein
MVLDNGRIAVRDLSFSQTVSLISELSKEEKEGFWTKRETHLQNGTTLKLVGNV